MNLRFYIDPQTDAPHIYNHGVFIIMALMKERLRPFCSAPAKTGQARP